MAVPRLAVESFSVTYIIVNSFGMLGKPRTNIEA